jgi:hypothetical protein
MRCRAHQQQRGLMGLHCLPMLHPTVLLWLCCMPRRDRLQDGISSSNQQTPEAQQSSACNADAWLPSTERSL